MSTSQPKSTTLNPSATEFVPSFVLQQNANPTSNGTSNGGAYVNNGGHYNNNHRNQHYYNNNNNYHNNNRSNGHQQQYRNHNNNNSYYNNNYSNNYNPNDVDPIEIEARCEAVIEILQDDNIRDQLNPSSRLEPTPSAPSHQTSSNSNYYYDDSQEPPCDDEEEMLEMMAMQEECRLEMMKFYIQSQNPSLFEEIYHDVSYPDAVKKPTEELRDPIVKPTEVNPTVVESRPVENSSTAEHDVTSNDKSNTTTTNDNPTAESTELKDLIINHLNPDAFEFIPSKFSNLKLNDDPVEDVKENRNESN